MIRDKKHLYLKYLSVFFLILFFKSSFAITEWTMLVYVQANNNLNKYAVQNFEAMSLIGSSSKLNILVQLYDSSHKGVWRYKVNKGKMILDTGFSGTNNGNKAEDLVDSMRWAATKYPAHKYFLVLWNHGIGVLDPVWGKTRIAVNYEMLTINPRIQLEGLTVKASNTNELFEGKNPESRGILFDEISRTYMTNYELVKALKDIKNNVLKKKLDILGMDACLMSMLEIGYQIRDYASYLLASEEVELANGWPYSSFLSLLAKGGLDAKTLSSNIISMYESFYKSIKIGFYTLSTIDLSKVFDVKNHLDLIVSGVKMCEEYDFAAIKKIIKTSYSSCLHFSTDSYIDLHSFYSDFSKNIILKVNQLKNKKNKKLKDINFLKYLEVLNGLLKIGIDGIENSVVSSAAGILKKRAKGISIYFPNGRIDNSYKTIEFSKQSLWLDFLRKYAA